MRRMRTLQVPGGGVVGSVRPTRRRLAGAVVAALAVAASGLVVVAPPASAASVTGASFTAGGHLRGGVLYARTGETLTLTVTTDSDTRCVQLGGAATATVTAGSTRTSWPIPVVAGAGNGVQTITATAYKKAQDGKCKGDAGEAFGIYSASYTLDNDGTGPVVTPTLDPAPNGAGWNNSDVTIRWSATDPSGVASITPTTDAVTASTTVDGVAKTTIATDNLGNTTTGMVRVKLDEDAPVVTGSRAPAANGAGWSNSDVTVSFTTSDALSGVATAATGRVLGEGAGQSVTGTGTDVAGNSASATVGPVNVDRTAPTLSGTPTSAPGGDGWYTGDVTIAWTAADTLSGLDAPAPADSTISGEGSALSATRTVTDLAGNSTTATSPLVKIDRTAPTTDATVPAGWSAVDQTVTLVPTDGGSGVATVHYQLDGGATQTGTSVAVSGDGEHSLRYWSTDRAGNTEVAKQVTVRVDRTAPTIRSSQSPLAVGGWNNSDVTVSFTCQDTGSGIASCSPSHVVATEGAAQAVTGTATDLAGNTATTTHVVNLDETAPTLTATVDRLANEHGWYRDDVTVTFSASDALSGISGAPAAQVLGEGAGQSARVSVADAAGNTASAGVTGINVDKTLPELSGTPSTTGWSRGDVTVTWTADDPLSGLLGGIPAPTIVTGEGADLTASTSVGDRAGNVRTTTLTGIRIDRTAPSTTATVPAPRSTGWYESGALVTLAPTDDLSGVARTVYTVDDGPEQAYTGPFTHSAVGVTTITFWSVDVAGNVEGERRITLKVDGTPPATTISLPQAFATGWYAGPVPVAFAATDAQSGVARTYFSVDGDTAVKWDGTYLHSLTGAHTISFWSVDEAGNVEAPQSQVLSVDGSVPTITGTRTPAANGAGWSNTDVTVSFDCDDSDSGVATCTPDAVVSAEGSGQSVTGAVTDNVGKTASTTVGGINIDKAGPVISMVGLKTSYTVGEPVAISCTATDALSGVDAGGCTVAVTGGTASGMGTHTYTATARDLAGNATTVTGTYAVVYGWNGFLQPINDTAHQVDQGLSVFKAGSTVPVKLQLRDAAGRVVQAGSAQWLAPVVVGSTTAVVSESTYSEAPTTGISFRYDATSQQHIYTWSTKGLTAGKVYRIGVLLDGGETHYVNIALR